MNEVKLGSHRDQEDQYVKIIWFLVCMASTNVYSVLQLVPFNRQNLLVLCNKVGTMPQ